MKSKHSSIVAELVMQYMGDFPAMDGRDAGMFILFFQKKKINFLICFH